MKISVKAALAAALLAGAATQALAQDRDHGDRGEGRGQAAAPHGQAAPRGPGQGAAPQQRGGGPGGPGFQRHEGAGGGERRVMQAAPGPQRFERGPGPGVAAQGVAPAPGRAFDREGARREVVPPVGDRGFDARRDGRQVGPGFDARRDGRQVGPGFDARRDGRQVGPGFEARRDGRFAGRGERWQAGRFPPVYWSQNRFRIGGYRAPYGYYVRSWAFGDFLPRPWFVRDYWISDFYDYDLPYPPPGFVWVRVGGDALLIDEYTGRIVQVVRGIFW